MRVISGNRSLTALTVSKSLPGSIFILILR